MTPHQAPPSLKRVVVTGMGLVTPLGVGIEANWEALMAGRSGIGPITRFDASRFKTRIAAEVKDFNAADFLDRKSIKRMDDFTQFAVASARMAMEASGFTVTDDNAGRIGCIVGCGLGGLEGIQNMHSTFLEKGPDRVSPFFIPMVIGNMAPGQISIDLGLKGPNLCTSTACTAGTHAVGQSFKLIQHGTCLGAVCGGVESVVTELAIGGFGSMKALSTRNDDPEKSSRPFDAERDGFVVGEGAGILFLEEMEHALARGATIHAEVVGFGMSSDAYHVTAPPPDGEGAIRSMRNAVADAQMSLEDIDYINAHGTSTEFNDMVETKAIKDVFGARAKDVPVSSTKSMTGHLLGGAGGVESVYSILSIERGVLPPTINYENPDPDCDLDYVPNHPRQARIRTAMSNSFGFGGTNGTLIFKAFTT
jgi:3-oxoacyl-[acyl-carrier-protein] synthase II